MKTVDNEIALNGDVFTTISVSNRERVVKTIRF